MDFQNSIFPKIDVDHSGGITPEEWEISWDLMLRHNHKPDSGVLSRKEWTLMGGENTVFDKIANKQGQMNVITKADWKRAFNKLDEDRNGIITAEEWHAVAAAYRTIQGGTTGRRGSQGSGGTGGQSQQGARLASPRSQGGYPERGEYDMQSVDQGVLREKLRVASETIQRHEKTIQERQARTQRAEWYYTNRINELRGQVTRSQETEEIVKSRLNEKQLQLQELQAEEAAVRERVERLEVQLNATKQQRATQAHWQADLEEGTRRAAKLDSRLDTVHRQAREMRGDDGRSQNSSQSASIRGGVNFFGGSEELAGLFKQTSQDKFDEAKAISDALAKSDALGKYRRNVGEKPIGLYFCLVPLSGAAQGATARLKSAYEGGLDQKMQIVFVPVSVENNQAEYDRLCSDLPWPYMEWSLQLEREALEETCQVDQGSPKLVILNNSFQIATHEGLAKLNKDQYGSKFPIGWLPQVFNDINSDVDAQRWIEGSWAVIALWERSQAIALAVRGAAKAALAEAHNDVLGMPIRFFNAQLPSPLADKIRRDTQLQGEKVLLTDFGSSPRKFYVCSVDDPTADDVKSFIGSVFNGQERMMIIEDEFHEFAGEDNLH